MSRYYEGDEEAYNNQWELWNANTQRALSGAAGQQALHDLEAALLALPEPRLISERLSCNGQVCTVAALVLHRRVAAGEDRDAVLAELEAALDEDSDQGWHVTAQAGKAVGLTYTLAYRLGELNDEDFRMHTPEERYTAVLAWVRNAQLQRQEAA